MLSTQTITRRVKCYPHDNASSEIRIRDGAYLSNLRLGNVGATVTGGSNVKYPSGSGVTEIFKSITLYAGNVVIDFMRETPQVFAMNLARKNNEQQIGVLGRTYLTEMGSQIIMQQISNPWSKRRMQAYSYGQYNRKNVNASNTGLVNLNHLLDFLNSTPILPFFKDLKIVITYNDLTEANRLVYDTPPTAYTILRPELYIDEIINPQMLEKLPRTLKLQYLSTEVDRQVMSLPANNTSVITYKYNPKTFDQKYLKDLEVCFVPDTVTNVQNSELCKNVSFAYYQNKYEVVLNGSWLFPSNGIDGPASVMYHNQISRGALQRGHFHFLYSRDGAQKFLNNDFYYQVGLQNYITHGVEDVVDNLEIYHTYQARGSSGSDQNSAGSMFLFGRVLKQLALMPDGKVLTSF